MTDLAAFGDRLSIQTSLRLGDDGLPVLEDDEQTSCSHGNVTAIIGDYLNLGAGTLILSTRRVLWIGNQPRASSMAIGYRQIIMHAISRDAQSFAQPCIYLQLDEGDMMDDAADDDEEMLSPEVRLVPEHAQLIEGIFKTLCDCAALNPDTDVEDEAAGDFFFNEAEVVAGLGPEERAAFLAQQVNFAVNIADEAQADERYEEDDDGDEQDGAAAGGQANGNGHTAS